jgi:hypothetical protein
MKLFSAGWMTRLGMMAVALLPALAAPALRAAADNADFTGHYELAGGNAEQSFSLDVTQTGSQVVISFSAAMADGSGAAPEGDGKGAVDKSGALVFTFKDSFDNEGIGTLTAKKNGYRLTLTMTKVAEPRALRFYGDVLLRKTSNKVQSADAESPHRTRVAG